MVLGRSVGSFKGASCDYEAIFCRKGVSDSSSAHEHGPWAVHPFSVCNSNMQSKHRDFIHSNQCPGETLYHKHPSVLRDSRLKGKWEIAREHDWRRTLTFRPSSVCGLLASTVPTQLGSLNLTKPKPRDWLVVLSFMITQSTTSPYWEK